MRIVYAKRSLREVCARRHLAIKTEQTYTHRVVCCGRFLQAFSAKDLPAEKKMEAFLSQLARSGVAASTQNQALPTTPLVKK